MICTVTLPDFQFFSTNNFFTIKEGPKLVKAKQCDVVKLCKTEKQNKIALSEN